VTNRFFVEIGECAFLPYREKTVIKRIIFCFVLLYICLHIAGNAAEMKFFFKVYEPAGKRNKKTLADARIQHKNIHEDEWHDFGGSGALSKADFSGSAGTDRPGEPQYNLAAAGTVSQLKSEADCSDTIFRVWKEGYESVFFDLTSLSGCRDKSVFYREIELIPYKYSDAQIFLKVAKEDGSPLEGARVQYLWNTEWQNFGDHVSAGQFSVTQKVKTRSKKPRQVNYSASGKLPVRVLGKKESPATSFRVVMKGCEPAYISVRFPRKGDVLKYYKEVTLKPAETVRLNLRIVNSMDSTPVAGAYIQYFDWYMLSLRPLDVGGLIDYRWQDLGKPGSPGCGRLRSKGTFFKSGNGQINYSVKTHVPDFSSKDKRHSRIVMRVIKEGFETEYFSVGRKQALKDPDFSFQIALRPCGLIGHWPLDMGTGDIAAEATSRGKAGKILGPTWVKDDNRTALKFEGSEDVVDFGTSPAYEQKEEITLLLWIKPAGEIVYNKSLIGRAWRNPYGLYTRKGNGLEVSLFLGTSKEFGQHYYMGRVGEAFYVTQKNILKPGEWNMVGFSYGNPADERIRLYHNGNAVAEKRLRKGWKNKGAIKPYLLCVPSNQPLSIGYFDGMGHFNGMIDDIRMYNYELSEEEVKKIYDGEK